MDLMGLVMAENQRTLKMTVLYRKGGVWHQGEIGRLVNGLMTEASQHPKYPEYVVLYGHYTKQQTLTALLGGMAYTATQITGLQDAKLPFRPGFI